MSKTGMVFLVGAGPGDVGLLTVRAADLLSRADVVVYDALVNAELLRMAPPQAEIIYAGKRAKAHAIPQDQLNALLVAKAKAGKCVVRLKGGDPYIFGRGGEEAEELAGAGVPFEVVPGISSFVAAPNYAGIPVTHRDHCSSFTVITGHEDPTKADTRIDWHEIGRTSGTKVILMGVERIREIANGLLAGGMSKQTPVAMIRWGTTGRQQSITGNLSTIADTVDQTGFTAPAVTIVGGVVELRAKLGWFEKRPLFGQRIVITRTRKQSSHLVKRLSELGAETLEIPTIKTVPPLDHRPLVDAIVGLNNYNWIVFTSPNGVDAFFEKFFAAFDDLRDFGGARIAAVGPATAAKLKELHLRVDVMPEKYVAGEITSAISAFEDIENLNICLLRAEVANAELPDTLQSKGAIVDDVACYRTEPETEDLTGHAARLSEEGADWITFTSSSTVEHFHARFDLPGLMQKFPKTRLASIGPETTKAIQALGLKPNVEASLHTIEGLVEAILKESALLQKSTGKNRPARKKVAN